MKQTITILCLFIFSVQIANAQTTLIDYGANWAYYDLGNEPADQGGDDWNDLGFDDASWMSGNAHLGYGDGDETTVINSNALTGYFRHEFNVNNPTDFASLDLNLTYDDGAVVYLNGVEVWRQNMPTGTITYNTFSSASSGDNAFAIETIASSLQLGNNVLAVEIHQRSASSSDISFDFKLEGIATPPSDVLISFGSNWEYYDLLNEPSDQGALDWNDFSYDASSWATGNAHMGYGDGDEITTTATANAIYMRHEFNVPDPTLFDALALQLIYDDGAVVYVNGVEVWRQNMPAGTITYNTYSDGGSTDNELANQAVLSNLVTGTNIVAVEVHQSSSTSSDVSFDLKVSGTLGGLSTIQRGPYLQKGSNDEVTVRWRTDLPAGSEVQYGVTQGTYNLSVTDIASKTEHEITLTGLTPNTIYYYQISDGSNILLAGTTDLYFKTAPNTGVDQPIRAWILGDCGTANSNQRAVRDAYYSYVGTDHTDVMLFLGDNAYNDGTDVQYQNAIFENMYEDKLQNTISWSCLGNHDGHSANSSDQSGPYYDIFSFPTAGEAGGIPSGTEAYYSFDYGNVHFISLDSYETDRSVGGTMYNWCQNDMQNTSADWIVAYWHHPPYTKGSHDSDSEGALVDMRENFLPMLESNGIDLVLSGHSHSYERSYFLNGHYGNSNSFDPLIHTVGANGDGDGQVGGTGAYEKAVTGPLAGDGAIYITAGSSGKTTAAALDHEAMFYSVADLGSCVLEVNGDTLDLKFVRQTGAIDDYFTIIKDAGCVVGGACDDGDVCTTGDVFDANCNCAGVFQDADSDGVCDANDVCPAFDDNLIGTACDDGDVCTTGDVYTSNCECAGVYQDADNDGICDANDVCPTLDDNLIGTACDDNDACTTGDVYTSNCECVGVFQDADSDGVCDANDVCPAFDDNLIGTSCDDGDVCTTGDVYTSNCECAGVYQDADNDGVCDANDVCPTLDDNLIGTACDDNDACTTGDVYTANCECVGVFQDADSDGVCDANDVCPAFDDNLIGTACDDGDVCTTGDVYTSNCECAGVYQDADNDGICDANDVCPTLDDNLIGTACDDNDACTTGDVYTANCECVGIFQDADSDGVCDANDVCPAFDDNLIGTACDDGDVCTTGDVYTSNCECAGVYQDADNDGICDANDVCPTLDDNLIGTACDDNDACTTGDVYTANCECVGVYQDADSDGVCDANDVCPAFDDNLIGTSCDDGDVCTTGDVYTSNCECAGVYQDADNDGYCVGNDPDDADPCNPDASSSLCDPCTIVSDQSFEAGLGMWNDGGGDCARVATYANTGTYSVRIRDNSGSSSSLYSDVLDWSGYDDVQIDFSYYPRGMDNNEDFFFEISTDGGSSFSNYKTWVKDVDFVNHVREYETLLISDYPFTTTTVIRFRCDASVNNDRIYLDDIVIEGCAAVSCTVGAPCDDGDACTINDTFDANCNCIGTFEDADNDGVCDADDQCPGTDDALIGTSCDDGDVCTINDVYDNNCNCAGVFADTDNDGICDGLDQCPNLDDSHIGTQCDDGDACTISDIYQLDCNCAGVFQDTDNDGVCDADDLCPGMDDALIGTSCDDGDVCTIGDVYDTNCQCVGVYTDADGDGYCVGNDPDDADGCVPDSNSPACSPCTDIFIDSFESGLGNWNDGGSDCARRADFPTTGLYSIRIRDNSGSASSMYTDVMDLSSYTDMNVFFSYYPNSMENFEDFFFEISTDGGSSFSLYQEWNSSVEFVNNQYYSEEVNISGYTFTANTVFRFRCDATANGDRIYIDDVTITTCPTNTLQQPPVVSNREENVEKEFNFSVYPIPTDEVIFIKVEQEMESIEQQEIVIYNLQGAEVYNEFVHLEKDQPLEVQVKDLAAGIYAITIRDQDRRFKMKKLIVVD